MVRLAKFSDCGKYRYRLWRIWDESKPIAMCIGLNPSTASHEKDDNTISILIKMLTALGFGSFCMCNLYALISSKPERLSSSSDPVGDNDEWIELTSKDADTIIFCWGAFKQSYYRAKMMKSKFPNAMCFGKSQDGAPLHPRALHYQSVTTETVKLIKF